MSKWVLLRSSERQVWLLEIERSRIWDRLKWNSCSKMHRESGLIREPMPSILNDKGVIGPYRDPCVVLSALAPVSAPHRQKR